MRSIVEMSAGVPAFLAKLWKLVDDPETDHLISWSPGGKMFNIQNQAEFAKELLPLYYKHNNMASFIRQLNMYGFHKVTSVENGGLKAEKDEIEFCHPYFVQGHPYLLESIKRKIAHPKPQLQNTSDDKSLLKPELMSKVLGDVKQIKGKQEGLDAKFSVMKHENEALWREVAILRQKHIKQQQIVNNLIQFLMSLVQPSRGGSLKTGGVKRRHQLMINSAAHINASSDDGKKSKISRVKDENNAEPNLDHDEENGPIIHELGDQDHLSDSGSVRNALLVSDPDARSSFSPGPSPSPSYSVGSSVAQEILIGADDSIPADYSESFDPLVESSMDLPLANKVIDNESIESTGDVIDNGEGINSASIGKFMPLNEDASSVPVASMSTTQTTHTLPTNIFEGDEANSQDGSTISLNEVDQQAALSALRDAERVYIDHSELGDIDFLNSMTSGAYNPNINLNSTASSSYAKGKKKKTKQVDDSLVRNIKEEILNPEEDDWGNMALATVPSEKRPALHRFQSVEDVDGHLDAMQADLDNIKQLLRTETYSLDTSALMNLFGDDSLYNLPPMNPSDMTLDKTKDAITDDSASQLISYTPTPLFDFGDIDLDDASNLEVPSEDLRLSDNDDSTLNTPQVSLVSPDFSKAK